MTRRRIAIPVALMALSGLGGCSFILGTEGLGDLEAAELRWEAFEPQSYSYAIERQCFCADRGRGPVRLTVVNGAVVEAVYIADGEPLTDEQRGWFPAVEGLFDILRDAIDRDAHEIRVQYDPVSGVPTDFWIDYEDFVADEELGFVVTEPVVPTS